MSKRAWMNENRAAVTAAIRGVCPNIGPLNDSDRWAWVVNDEGLYLWAQGDGVNV